MIILLGSDDNVCEKRYFFVRRLTNRYGNKQIFADLGYWLIPTGDSGFLKLLSGCEEFLESISPWQFIYMCSSLIRNDSGNFRLHHIVALSETAILSACDWNTSTRIFFFFFFFSKKKKQLWFTFCWKQFYYTNISPWREGCRYMHWLIVCRYGRIDKAGLPGELFKKINSGRAAREYLASSESQAPLLLRGEEAEQGPRCLGPNLE